MSAAKVLARVGTNQMKVLVEFIPDEAARGDYAFPHGKSNAPMLDRGLHGLIVGEQCFVQIAPWKQQAQPLLSNPHAVDLKRRPHLARSAKHALSIKRDQCRLKIPIVDT